ADVVPADLQVRRGVLADDLLDLVAAQVDDDEGDPAVGHRGGHVRAVRADRRAHDLALVDHQAGADRLDVLVARDDLALAGQLADMLGAELRGRRGADGGTGENERDRGHADLGEASSATPAVGNTLRLPDRPSTARYLH